MKFPAIYLLHGRGGSPNGSVLQLETELCKCEPQQNYVRPLLPHSDPTVMPWTSVLRLRELRMPEGTLVIGISLGGLVAAKLQELERPDLHVICISSPTHVEETELHTKMERRVALYSSADPVIAGRTEMWPKLAEAYDLPWLTHDTDKHKHSLASAICGYIERGDVLCELGPRVGIFWKLDERRLILDWTPLGEAGDYGDFKIHEGDHCSHWEKMEALGVVPPGSDYEESPRGRVVYSTKTGRFILYADACILNDKATLAKIMRHLQLPSDAELKRDSHYRCFRCLSGDI